MFLQINLCPFWEQAGPGGISWGLWLQQIPGFCCMGLLGTKLVCNWVIPSSLLLWIFLRLVCVKLKELWYLLGQESVCSSPNTSEICLLIRAMVRGTVQLMLGSGHSASLRSKLGLPGPALQSSLLGKPHPTSGNSFAEVAKRESNLVPHGEQQPQQILKQLKTLKSEGLWVREMARA